MSAGKAIMSSKFGIVEPNFSPSNLAVMKAFEASLPTVIIRFYLMVGVVILAGFMGVWWLALLSLPIFLSSILCIKFNDDRKEHKKDKMRMVQMEEKSAEMKKAS